MSSYSIISNRAEYPLATCDDIDHAGRIVDALMRTRQDPEWLDYWVRGADGTEYYWDEGFGTVFSAACFAEKE